MLRRCHRAVAGPATAALRKRIALRDFGTKYEGDVGDCLRFTCAHPSSATLTPRDFHGRVVLVVNTASQCTHAATQLPALQQLYATYHARGLDIIAVPSNDFDKKEPLGSDAELAMVYTSGDGPFKVAFPVATKSTVLGESAHEFFVRVAQKYGRSVAPTWNFDKFLIDGYGDLCAVFPHDTEPLVTEVIEAIEDALADRPTDKDLEADSDSDESDSDEENEDSDDSENHSRS